MGEGRAWRHYKYNLENMTIPEVDKKTEDKIVSLVVSLEEEREIDGIVYGLYGLTGEEIKVVERKN